MKKILYFLVFAIILGFAMNSSASYLTGGDAASQADADVILDIVFAADTSGSMYDELLGISNSITGIVSNLDCPDCDVWVRARFMGITGTYTSGGAIFDETVYNYALGAGALTTEIVSNHIEDNAPAVVDLATWYDWNDDSTVDQDYYKAIVTIGDEGAENGSPGYYQSDYDAAYAANQAADINDILLFTLQGYPDYGAGYTFPLMSQGGAGGGHVFDNTGGLNVLTTSNTLEIDIENIICTAASGGTNNNPVPEPATMLLFGIGLLGLAGVSRKK